MGKARKLGIAAACVLGFGGVVSATGIALNYADHHNVQLSRNAFQKMDFPADHTTMNIGLDSRLKLDLSYSQGAGDLSVYDCKIDGAMDYFILHGVKDGKIYHERYAVNREQVAKCAPLYGEPGVVFLDAAEYPEKLAAAKKYFAKQSTRFKGDLERMLANLK